MIAPEQRFGFFLALLAGMAALLLGVLGVVLLARRYKPQQGGMRALFVALMLGSGLFALAGAVTAFVIAVVFLGNNR